MTNCFIARNSSNFPIIRAVILVITILFPLFSFSQSDCNGDVEGSAYIDDCENCVGGNTGNEPCIEFSPEISINITQPSLNQLVDINFTVDQDANEPDILTNLIASDAGEFVISSLSVNQHVGFGNVIFGGGSNSASFDLLVDFIVSSDQVSLKAIAQDDEILGTFTIKNTLPGIEILSIAPSDGNNVTGGNSQSVTLTNIFQSSSSVEFTSTTTSETYVQVLSTTFVEFNNYDCSEIVDGLAYIDDCGNCVGGTTGQEPCVEFNPVADIILSSNQCNEVIDLTFNINQSANQPDVSNSLLTSNDGTFNFNGIEIGQEVGSASLSAAGGEVSFETILVVNSIDIDEIIIGAVNVENGDNLGSCVVSNLQTGVSIIVNINYPDGNNVTAGNNSTINLNGLFNVPQASSVSFYATVNSELGDTYNETFELPVDCDGQLCTLLGDANCDNIVNLADLTLVLNNWLQSTETGTNGDVIGSHDGFVNLEDLTLVLNNWLVSIIE